jgi:hypothetical protein
VGTPAQDVLRGRGGNDRIDGRAGADRLYGDAGNDVITAGDGDTVNGGSGRDRVKLSVTTLNFRVNCGTGRDRVAVRAPRALPSRAILSRLKNCEARKITRTKPDATPPAPTPSVGGGLPPETSPSIVPAPADVAPPETTLGTAITGTTSTFTFSTDQSGASFQCRLDGPGRPGAYDPCASPVTYTGLAFGSYTFFVRAVASSGASDPTPATHGFVVAMPLATAPTITSPVDGSWSNTSTITVSGTAEAGRLVTLYDGTSARGTTSATLLGQWSIQIADVSDGPHTYTATADNSPLSAKSTVHVDTQAPETTITSGPTGTTTDPSPAFAFASTDATASFECRLDGPAGTGTYQPCTAPQTYTDLADGTYSFNVRAKDPAENHDPTPATRDFTIKRRVNVVADAIWTAPGSAIAGEPVTFDGCGSNGDAPLAYEWSWGSASSEVWATTCSASYTFPSAGPRVVALRVTDGDGETSYAEKEFNVAAPPDPEGPETTIEGGPDGTDTRSFAGFKFSSSKPGSWFRCRLDFGLWSWCSSPKAFVKLANGEHTFEVAAVDPDGNFDASPAARTWTVDAPATPPGQDCMTDPSVCGFPDVENTGVTPGTTLAPINGDVTLETPGELFENKLVTGSIIVAAPNVTIRNVKLIATGDYGIRSFSWLQDVSGLILDHVEIDLNGRYDVKGLAFDGYTARHVFFHNGSDCAHMGVNATVEDSLCTVGLDADGDGWPDDKAVCDGTDHLDGIQSDGGSNLTIRHNTIRNPCSQTSAILMSTNTEPIKDVTIQDNLLAGGGYSLYCSAGPKVVNEAVVGNRFARTYFPDGGFWGPHTGCSTAYVFLNNVWDDTGRPVG